MLRCVLNPQRVECCVFLCVAAAEVCAEKPVGGERGTEEPAAGSSQRYRFLTNPHSIYAQFKDVLFAIYILWVFLL